MWSEIRRMNDQIARSDERITGLREQSKGYQEQTLQRFDNLDQKIGDLGDAVKGGQAVVRFIKWGITLPFIGGLFMLLWKGANQ